MKINFKNAVYDGQSIGNKMYGVGRLTFNNGDYYIGQFTNNQYNGYGEYYFSNGSYYRGNWVDGKKSGKGIWHEIEFHYEGDFKNGTYHGQGIMTLKDGTVICGNWQDGLQIGDNTFYYPNGQSLWKIFGTPGGNIRNALSGDYEQEWIDSAKRKTRKAINDANLNNYLYVKQVLEGKTAEPTPSRLISKENEKSITNTVLITSNNVDEIKQANELARKKQEEQEKLRAEQERKKQEEQRKLQEKIEKANSLFNKALELFKNSQFKDAIKFLDDVIQEYDEINFKSNCKKLRLICRAMLFIDNDNYSFAIELLNEAKELTQTNLFIDEINQSIKVCKDCLEVKKLHEEINDACDIANDGNYAKAIELFKAIIRKTSDQSIIKTCEDYINQCVSAIKEIQYNERIEEEYNTACNYYNNGNYSLAMQYFKSARSMSDDFDFKKQCDKDIKDCEESIEAEDESRAIDFYNDGVFYFNNGEMQKAKWKFEEAYNLSSDRDFRNDCEEMIDSCKEYLY